MTLTPEQKTAVASWVAAGDNLSAVQKSSPSNSSFRSPTATSVSSWTTSSSHLRTLRPRSTASDVSKAPPKAASADKPAEKKGFLDKAKEKLGLAKDDDAAPDADATLDDDLAPASASVSVTVDKATLIPGAIASGSVTFSDGVTGNWVVDQYGRPGFSKISQPGLPSHARRLPSLHAGAERRASETRVLVSSQLVGRPTGANNEVCRSSAAVCIRTHRVHKGEQLHTASLRASRGLFRLGDGRIRSK